MSNYYLLFRGDFAYNKSYSKDYPWGAVKRLNNFDKGVVSNLYICFKPYNVNSDFLECYFETTKWNKGISNIAGEGARNHGLLNMSTSDFFCTKHYIPSIDEQISISGLIKKINIRIMTQNKIIEDLNKLKKSLIEDNFANTKFSVSLKEVLKERKSYSEKGLEYEHVTLSKDGIIPKGERYDRDFLVTDESKEYKITKLNDICYNPANLKFGVICLNNYKDSIFSPIYVTFEVDKKYNPYYVSLYLTSDRFIKKILKYQQGTVYERMSVNPDDFLKGRLPIIKNQESFISLIKTIDNKCTVEKELLKTFEIQKEYLLKNMFI